MARPRLPPDKAKALGSDKKHASRFEGRNAPIVKDDIGEPFVWLSENAKTAWREISDEIPWLNKSHRGVLSIASKLRGRMMGDSSNGETDLGIQGMNLYQVCLGKMGATPADSTKAGVLPNGDEKEPGEEFFDR